MRSAVSSFGIPSDFVIRPSDFGIAVHGTRVRELPGGLLAREIRSLVGAAAAYILRDLREGE